MGKYFLGVDQGTTRTTAVLLAGDLRIAGQGWSEHEQFFPQPGWVEHDPEELFQCCLNAIDSAIKDAGAAIHEITGMGIAHQGETVVVWDRCSGLPLYKAIVWMDVRTAGAAEALRTEHGNEIRGITGLFPNANHGGQKIKWILDNVEETAVLAERGDLMAGTLNTWLMYKLSGGRIYATDACSAGRLMLSDLKRSQWSPVMLRYLGLPDDLLPPIYDCNSHFGYTASDVFGAEIAMKGSISDGMAAMIGQGNTDVGALKITYGTGAFAILLTGESVSAPKDGLNPSCCWKINGKPEYCVSAPVYAAGAAVEWLKRNLGLFTSYDELAVMAKSVPDSAGVYFIPAFSGLGTPYFDKDAKGALLGLTGAADRR
jgi:glycerol kinase